MYKLKYNLFINLIVIFKGQSVTPAPVYPPSYQKPVSSNQYGNQVPYPGSAGYPGTPGK